MKHFSTLLFLFVFGSAFSQDTIVLFNGRTVIAKVLEINSKEVRYKAADNLDGPVYVKRLSLVTKITYANGKEEIFSTRSERNDLFMAEEMARHAFYFELFGNTIEELSFNYDYTFYRTPEHGFAVRFGINPDLFEPTQDPFLTFPITASFLYGQNAALEIGAGGVLASYSEYNYGNGWWPVVPHKDVVNLFPTGIFGFRFQKRDNVFFRLVITPVFLMKRVSQYNSWIERNDISNINVYTTVGVNLGFAL